MVGDFLSNILSVGIFLPVVSESTGTQIWLMCKESGIVLFVSFWAARGGF